MGRDARRLRITLDAGPNAAILRMKSGKSALSVQDRQMLIASPELLVYYTLTDLPNARDQIEQALSLNPYDQQALMVRSQLQQARP